MTSTTRTPSTKDGTAELADAIQDGVFFRLRPELERDIFPLGLDVPNWVPRSGYTSATPALARRVLAGLKEES